MRVILKHRHSGTGKALNRDAERMPPPFADYVTYRGPAGDKPNATLHLVSRHVPSGGSFFGVSIGLHTHVA